MEPETTSKPVDPILSNTSEKPVEISSNGQENKIENIQAAKPPASPEPVAPSVSQTPTPPATASMTSEASEAQKHFADTTTPDTVASVPATAVPPAAPVGTIAESGAIPQEVKGWNWGAFFLSWIWAIGNKTWIGLLALLGPISLIMMIVLGIKGSEWAWKNRKFESIDQFKSVQKAWAKWGLIIFIIGFVFSVAAIGFTFFFAAKSGNVSTYHTTELELK